MIYAIHEEKRSVDFYGKMAQACEGAPMESMFRRLQKDEAKHLASLEELYESIYMPEMWERIVASCPLKMVTTGTIKPIPPDFDKDCYYSLQLYYIYHLSVHFECDSEETRRAGRRKPRSLPKNQ